MSINNKHVILFFSLALSSLSVADSIKPIECNTQGSTRNYLRVCIAEIQYNVGNIQAKDPVVAESSSAPSSDTPNVGCVLNDDGSVEKCMPPPQPHVCGEDEAPKHSLLMTLVQVANKKVVFTGVVPLSASFIGDVQPLAEDGSQPLRPPYKPTVVSYFGQHYPNIKSVNQYTLEVGQVADAKGRVKTYLSRNNKLLLKTPFYFSQKNLVDKIGWCEAQPEPAAK